MKTDLFFCRKTLFLFSCSLLMLSVSPAVGQSLFSTSGSSDLLPSEILTSALVPGPASWVLVGLGALGMIISSQFKTSSN